MVPVEPATSRPLTALPLRSPVRLDVVGSDPAGRLRMAELGLRTGATVTVVGRAAGGGRVLRIGTARIAVDRATAAALTGFPVDASGAGR